MPNTSDVGAERLTRQGEAHLPTSPPTPAGWAPVPAALRSRNPFGYFRFFGPGAIIASVTVGTGETVFASRGGAIFGYAILWALAWGALLKAVQAYAGMRFVVLTGEHPVLSWARLPGPRGWFPVSMALMSPITLAPVVSALPKILATLLVAVVGIPAAAPGYTFALNLTASICLLVCAAAALGSSYRVLEVSQTVIVLVFVAFILGAFLAMQPEPMKILRAFLVPEVPAYPRWVVEDYPAIARRTPLVEVMTYMGMIGGSAADYLAYLSFVGDKKWGRVGGPSPVEVSGAEVAVARLWLRAPLTDVTLSFSVLIVITSVFVILGAHLLGPSERVPQESSLLTVQARFLTDLHPGLFPLYVVGILAVFGGTMYGAFEVQTRAIAECWRSLAGGREVPTNRIRRALVAFGLVTGGLLIWTNWDPVAIITPAAILAGVFGCGLWCFAMLWTDARYLPPPLRLGPVLRTLLAAAGVIMTGLGARAMVDYVRSLV